jgi:hypothetical protein
MEALPTEQMPLYVECFLEQIVIFAPHHVNPQVFDGGFPEPRELSEAGGNAGFQRDHCCVTVDGLLVVQNVLGIGVRRAAEVLKFG